VLDAPEPPRKVDSGIWTRTKSNCRFQSVAEVYRVVSEDTILGKELPDARVRGQTVEDVVTLISEGIDAKRGKLLE
jgi:hypothetical protein